MLFKNKYFTQDKPSTTLSEKILFLIKAPFLLPRWIVSFLLARAMTNLILSPTYAGPQKKIHHVYLSDNLEENGNVVVNLIPHDSYKVLRDYLLKFCSVFRIPFLAPKRKVLSLERSKDKAYIDSLINEIDLLISGQSKIKRCAGKKFTWEDIHLKGIEYLDEGLRAYLFDTLRDKYGSEVDKPRTANIEFYNLETSDDAVLDSVAVSTASEDCIPMAERKFVITCLANGQNYINWIKDLHYSAKEIGCTVIGFNYRGIDYSQGMIWTEENMVTDVMAQVKNLLAMGAKPENIGVEGMCLGGAVATLSAARLHNEGLKINLYNERSFRSISRSLAGTLLPGVDRSLWNPISWLQYLTAAVVFVVCAPFIWLAGWSMDVGSAWDRIPEANKSYSVVRNIHDADPNAKKEDGIIEDRLASLASLVDENRAAVVKKKECGDSLSTDEELILNDKPDQHNFKVDPMYKGKKNVPHTIARRHLIKTNEGETPCTMHQDMIRHFKHKFFKPKPLSTSVEPYQENIHAISI